MFDIFRGRSPKIMKEIFQFRGAVPYQLKNKKIFKSHLHIVFSVKQKVQNFSEISQTFFQTLMKLYLMK